MEMAQKITDLIELLENSRCRLVVQSTSRGKALKDSQDAFVDVAEEMHATAAAAVAGSPNMSISDQFRPRQSFGDIVKSSMQNLLGFADVKRNGSGIYDNILEHFSGGGGRDIGGRGGSGGGGSNDDAGEERDDFGRGRSFIILTMLLASLGYFIHFIYRGYRHGSVWLPYRYSTSNLLRGMRNGQSLKNAGSQIRHAEAPFCRNYGSTEMTLPETTLACATSCDSKSIHTIPSSTNATYGLETRTTDVLEFAARAIDGSGADFSIMNGPPLSSICYSAKKNGSTDSGSDDAFRSGEAMDCDTGVQVGHFTLVLNKWFACRLTCSPAFHRPCIA